MSQVVSGRVFRGKIRDDKFLKVAEKGRILAKGVEKQV
jgi:hypothetical protein